MDRFRCFWIEPTGRTFSYRSSWKWLNDNGVNCPVHGPCHRGETESTLELQRGLGPEACACGYQFTKAERSGGGSTYEYRRTDTNEIIPIREPWPVGAMWNATWLIEGFEKYDKTRPLRWQPGDDGRCVVVMTPGGEWMIDSRASNCEQPNDNAHRCWCRHGSVPDLTVDKNGLTCKAGAGSIQCGSYHGYLRGGWLEPA